MKNIAAFIEINSGKLSPRSLQIIHLIQSIQQENQLVFLYTFNSVDEVEIPRLSNVSLFEIQHLADSAILSENQIDHLISKIQTDSCDFILGYKSTLMDVIFANASIQADLPIVPQVLTVGIGEDQLTIQQSIFSGKAVTSLSINKSCILQFNAAFESQLIHNETIFLTCIKFELPTNVSFQISAINKVAQGANLVDAAFVVGAGRGLKDPSNWGMIEALADKLGAATACSKPVSDINWRPHSEHVGQTGIKIAPQLYIACGISGAIQHLAGVNGSKTIIVINNDPEAPFFKYADYGIVGDVFDVIPEILNNL